MSHEIKIVFDNPKVAEHFVIWMSEQGEQDYFEWMRYREKEESGNITAVSFNYNGTNNKGVFMEDSTIRTESGRLDSE